jgi:hypothetical protein
MGAMGRTAAWRAGEAVTPSRWPGTMTCGTTTPSETAAAGGTAAAGEVTTSECGLNGNRRRGERDVAASRALCDSLVERDAAAMRGTAIDGIIGDAIRFEFMVRLLADANGSAMRTRIRMARKKSPPSEIAPRAGSVGYLSSVRLWWIPVASFVLRGIVAQGAA